MTQLFKNHNLFRVLKTQIRHKNPPHHWSVLKKKKPSTKKALEHFDDFYKSIYGDDWINIRSALLTQKHKYVAIINNFSDTERICKELESLGAMSIKEIYDATKRNFEWQKDLSEKKKVLKEVHRLDKKLDEIVAKKQQELYPNICNDQANVENVTEDKDEIISSKKPVQLQSIEKSVNRIGENDRLIKSSMGISASQLYEYIPATKIKGLDDFVLESDHYKYYSQGSDFIVRQEKEYTINFPKNLLIYTFEENNFTRFPRSKNGSTGVSDYFVLDGASVLPILSLDLQPGDVLLDMCAAPGGKALTAFQTLNPRLIVANDIQLSRINRINDFINEFLLDTIDWNKKFIITQSDARYIEDNNLYNKILVDVPCTTDRHVLHEDDNNIFKSNRLKERLQLPELQSSILANALKLVVPGGTVVYSTCSLSPVQNDGVVQMALKTAFEESNNIFLVKDQSRALAPLQYLYNFGNFGLKYGHIVIPSKARNWGPLYFCKMVRIK